MIHPWWYRAWRDEPKTLPRSQGHAIEITKTEIIPLKAQLAVMTGQPEGDLAAVRVFIKNLKAGDPIRCKICDGHILDKGHAPTCELVAKYREVTEVQT